MSLGSPNPVQEVRKAIQHAQSKGVVCFVAGGNAGRTKKLFYPAEYPETVAIGSIDENFGRSNFSNTGDSLDFMAPGGRILSTVPDNWYAILSGTSMATPFAVGVAALVLSYMRRKGMRPPATADEYIKHFSQHTLPVSNADLKDQRFYQGFGIIDPRKIFESID
jgi:subtilisin family serine protease